MKSWKWIVLGSFLAATAVALGAFGAHGMRGLYSDRMMAVFETAVKYQMYHALALVGVGAIANQVSLKILDFAGWTLLAGTVLFSGSLYAIVFFEARFLGIITPLGGLTLIIGWVMLAVTGMKMKNL